MSPPNTFEIRIPENFVFLFITVQICYSIMAVWSEFLWRSYFPFPLKIFHWKMCVCTTLVF